VSNAGLQEVDEAPKFGDVSGGGCDRGCRPPMKLTDLEIEAVPALSCC
jgi:hypothetical protein